MVQWNWPWFVIVSLLLILILTVTCCSEELILLVIGAYSKHLPKHGNKTGSVTACHLWYKKISLIKSSTGKEIIKGKVLASMPNLRLCAISEAMLIYFAVEYFCNTDSYYLQQIQAMCVRLHSLIHNLNVMWSNFWGMECALHSKRLFFCLNTQNFFFMFLKAGNGKQCASYRSWGREAIKNRGGWYTKL